MLRTFCSRTRSFQLFSLPRWKAPPSLFVYTRLSSSVVTSSEIPEGTTIIDEEPLGVPAEHGFGFFQGGPQDVLGPDGRFQLQAKLGYGRNSSVWLAKDRQVNTHIALKILSGYASHLNELREFREVEVHQRLASLPTDENKHCRQLITHFVWDHYRYDIKYLSIPVVKRILRHMLHGLAALHKCGVAHTDFQPNNIMIELSPALTTDAIDGWVKSHPPRTYKPYKLVNKAITQAFVSESLPIPTIDELSTCVFKLADFSNAQEVDDIRAEKITALTLRPPEVILGGQWDEKVDIWTFGCLIFTILTHRSLFLEDVPPVSRQYLRTGFDENTKNIGVDHVLYMMALITDQRFPPKLSDIWPESSEYFEENGEMKRFAYIPRRPIEICIRDTGCTASAEDVAGVSALMRRCLRFNPFERPSALELLEDPWLKET